MTTALLVNVLGTIVTTLLGVAALLAYLRYKWFVQGIPLRREIKQIALQVFNDEHATENARAYAALLTIFSSSSKALRVLARAARQRKGAGKPSLGVPRSVEDLLNEGMRKLATLCMLEDWRLAPRASRALKEHQELPRDVRRSEEAAVRLVLVQRAQIVRAGQLQSMMACHC